MKLKIILKSKNIETIIKQMGNSSSLGSSSTADEVAQSALGLSSSDISSSKLSGLQVLITGANSGIGLEAARVLSNHGARVLLACRSKDKAIQAIQTLQEKQNLTILPVNLSSLKDIQRALEQHKDLLPEKIDVLINNAGVMMNPEYSESEDGYELQFATNHLGHFLLTKLLRDRLADNARVVNVSSRAHFNGKIDFEHNMPPNQANYSPRGNYGISKACNILFSRQLQKEFSGTNKTAYSLHPGVIPSTELFKHIKIFNVLGTTILSPFFKSIPQGTATTIYCAIHPDAPKYAGEYFSDCQVADCSDDAKSMENAEKLWTLSEHLVQSALQK
jgi:retinol dehydrogenase 12